MATKLLAVSASINAGLEKSMVEIMVSVPRVVTEVQRVEAAIKRLHGELENLSGQARTSLDQKIQVFRQGVVKLARRGERKLGWKLSHSLKHRLRIKCKGSVVKRYMKPPTSMWSRS